VPLLKLYRDLADAEHNFDELRNQWAGLGWLYHPRYRTLPRHGAHCGLGLQLVDAIRQARSPHSHLEAISSRPLLLHGVATQTRHTGLTCLTITNTHTNAAAIQALLTSLASFLSLLKAMSLLNIGLS